MPTLQVESVFLTADGPPHLVFLTAVKRGVEYCQAEVFIVSPGTESGEQAYGSGISIDGGDASESFGIAVAREVGRKELSRRLRAINDEAAPASIQFEESDLSRIRAERCLGAYPQLGGLAGRSRWAHGEIRSFVEELGWSHIRVFDL